MSQNTHGFVNPRVLKLNVGFLLATGPGHSHDSQLELPALRVSDDLDIEYLHGRLRLTRTKEGILVQADLKAGVEGECYRCLTPVTQELDVELEELYATQPQRETEFRILDDGILDLAPLLRAEILIEEGHRVLCREDCQGLCPTCGANRNTESCNCDVENIDPRLAALKNLLD